MWPDVRRRLEDAAERSPRGRPGLTAVLQRASRLRALQLDVAGGGERLARFLEDEALRVDRTASLLARARARLRDEHVLAPADSVLRRAIGAARHKARALLCPQRAGASATSIHLTDRTEGVT